MTQQDEELVELVRQYTHLWDKTHTLFRNKHAKNNAWTTIADIMHISAEQASTRWTILRARYVKERKRALESVSGMAGGTEAEWPLYQLMGFLDPMIIPRRTHSNIQSDGSSQSTSGVWDTMPTIMGSDEDAPPTPDEENRARTPQAEAGTEVQPEPERPESQGASSRFAHRRRQLLRRGSVSRGAPVPVQVNNHMMGKMDEIVRFITQQNVVENDDILFGRSFGMTLSYVRNRQKKALLKANVMRQLGQLLAEDEADQDLQQPE